MEKEFKASDLFEIKKGKRLTKADMLPGEIPFVGSSAANNGITARIGNNQYLHPANTFTVSYNGSVGEVFLQDERFWASDDVNVWYPRFAFNREAVQYIMAAIKKLSARYGYTAKWTIDKMRGERISLPVVPSADPAHVYTPADIDWGYMERCIAELEEERVAELEAYLQAAGLDDCELTPQDEQALAEEPPFAEFTCDELFELVNPRGKLTTRQLIEGKDLPYVGAKKTNNGVAKMCSKVNIPEEDIMPGGAIVFVQQGDGAAGYTTYQPGPFYAISCVCCGYNENLNDKVGMYLMAQLDKNKALYSHSQSWNGTKIKQTTLSLPVVPSADPSHVYAPADIDWGYMERYIRATEKLVMADVVAYKDRVIAETRRIVCTPAPSAT